MRPFVLESPDIAGPIAPRLLNELVPFKDTAFSSGWDGVQALRSLAVLNLQNTLHFAMGAAFDPAKGEALPAGGFFVAPKGMQHYAWSSEPTVIQIHGEGPFAINYVNPADDPRTMASSKPSMEGTTGTNTMSK